MLLGMELVRELIHTVFLTGRVQHEAPVSVLLIGAPQTGKTSIVLERPAKCFIAFTDVTGRALQELCKLRPEVTHIVLNDMVALASHKESVTKYTLATINAMTEEGIQCTAYPGTVEHYKDGKRGIIACTTAGLNKDSRRWWNKIGLSSRMLPFFYDHSSKLEIRIVEAINKAGAGSPVKKSPEELKIPDIPIYVHIPPALIEPITKLAAYRAVKLADGKPYRRLKQYRSLVKGHALMRSWKNPVKVTEQDVDFLARIDPYVSYTEERPL